MQTFSFTIYVKETDIMDEQVYELYELAPDATIGVHCGKSYVSFDREGTFEVDTIKGALGQLKKVGLTPSQVADDSGLSERKY
jgi:hypothetical protein